MRFEIPSDSGLCADLIVLFKTRGSACQLTVDSLLCKLKYRNDSISANHLTPRLLSPAWSISNVALDNISVCNTFPVPHNKHFQTARPKATRSTREIIFNFQPLAFSKTVTWKTILNVVFTLFLSIRRFKIVMTFIVILHSSGSHSERSVFRQE